MKKSEIREMIVEEVDKLNEAQKYPSQEDAEAMLEWYKAVNGVYFGGAREARKAFEKADDIRIKAHMEIFGNKSPWSIERKGRKAEVVWNNNKAEALGL